MASKEGTCHHRDCLDSDVKNIFDRLIGFDHISSNEEELVQYFKKRETDPSKKSEFLQYDLYNYLNNQLLKKIRKKNFYFFLGSLKTTWEGLSKSHADHKKIDSGRRVKSPSLSALVCRVSEYINLDGGLEELVTKILRYCNSEGYIIPALEDYALIIENLFKSYDDGKLIHPANEEDSRFFPAEIKGADDYRLVPFHHQSIVGRVNSIDDVVTFLNGQGSSAYVTGVAGIGKTEVCRAALKSWIETGNACRLFWINVTENTSAEELLKSIALAFGLDIEEAAKIKTIEQLQTIIPEGLIYLDNLETAVQSQVGANIVNELARFKGIRVLASSFISLDGILNFGIEIDRLDKSASVKLFSMIWAGKETPTTSAIESFVDKELGGHTLSIYLIASLGRKKTFSQILANWKQMGTALASLQHGSSRASRYTNLDKVLDLTRDAIKDEAGALELWQFAALFPDGFDEQTLKMWEYYSQSDQASLILQEFNLLKSRNDIFSLLPPIARYALGKNSLQSDKDSAFDWHRSRHLAYCYFANILTNSILAIGTEYAARLEMACAKQVQAIKNLMEYDLLTKKPLRDKAFLLHRYLHSVYVAYPAATISLTDTTLRLFADHQSFYNKSHYEFLLGNVSAARSYLGHALRLTEGDDDLRLNYADCLNLLGEIKLYEMNYVEAIAHFLEARNIFRDVKAWRGFCNSCRQCANAYTHQGNYEVAFSLYEQAKSKSEEIGDYLTRALILSDMADLLISINDLQKASDYCNEAFQVFSNLKRDHGQANVLMALGKIENQQRNFEGANNFFQEAMQLFEVCRDVRGAAAALNFLANSNKHRGLFDKADDNYRSAMSMYQSIDYKYGLIILLRDWADLHVKMGSITNARELIQQSISLNQTVDRPDFLAKSYEFFRDLEIEESNINEAEKYCYKAAELYQELQDHQSLAIMCEKQLNYCISKNKFEEANAYARQAAYHYVKLKSYRYVIIRAKLAAILFLLGEEPQAYVSMTHSARQYYRQGFPTLDPLPIIILSELALNMRIKEIYETTLQNLNFLMRVNFNKTYSLRLCLVTSNILRISKKLGKLEPNDREQAYKYVLKKIDALKEKKESALNYLAFSIYDSFDKDEGQYKDFVERHSHLISIDMSVPTDPTCDLCLRL